MMCAASEALAERKPRLERGELAEAGPPEAVRIPLDLIDPNPQNPRKKLAEVDALAESVKDFGLLQPVTVRRVNGRYELIGGHRRWSAFLLLSEQEPADPRWRSIPAVITAFDDQQAYLALITSQVQHRTWSPREEASALERLAQAGLTLREIGARLHRSEVWASKRLGVYSDATLSAYVQSGRLGVSVAEEFLPVPDPATKRTFAEQAIAENWSQPKARAEVKRLTTSRLVRQLSRRAKELRDILSAVTTDSIPLPDKVELLRLARLINRMAGKPESERRGPRIPTIAEAEKVAGVSEHPQARRKQPARRMRIPVAPENRPAT